MEEVTHGRDPQSVPLPDEPLIMHTSLDVAELDAAYTERRTTGLWPEEAQRDSSGASEPGWQPVVRLSCMPLGIAALVISRVPGYAYLMREWRQVTGLCGGCCASGIGFIPFASCASVWCP
jgi:hypothetical protein